MNYKLDINKISLLKEAAFYFALIYCLFFFVFRLILIDSALSPDEAEQIYLSHQVFKLSIGDQAPLYTWIVKLLSFIFPINILSLSFLKYLIFFQFHCFNYLIIREFWNKKNSLYISLFTLLIFHYSFETNFDLTHSLLLMSLSTLSIWQLIQLIKRRTIFNYTLFGVFLALGLLSKYNFSLLILAIVLGVFFQRKLFKRLFNQKIFFSFLSFALILSPHLYGILTESKESINHMINTTGTIKTGFVFMKVSSMIFLKYLLVLLPASLVFLWIFRSNLSEIKSKFLKEKTFIRKPSILIYFTSIGILGFLFPIIYAFLTQAVNFQGRWGNFIYFLIIQILFFLIYHIYAPNRKSEILFPKFLSVSLITALISLSLVLLKLFIFYFPDQKLFINKKRSNIPYANLSKRLSQLFLGELDNGTKQREIKSLIIVSKHTQTAGNLMIYFPEYQILTLKDFEKKLSPELISNNDLIFLWDGIRFKDWPFKELKKILRKKLALSVNLSNPETIHEKYLYSNKDFVLRLTRGVENFGQSSSLNQLKLVDYSSKLKI
jgi:4-amino-4-deoxy-L-arabinose transferase-like glycosyltransferase